MVRDALTTLEAILQVQTHCIIILQWMGLIERSLENHEWTKRTDAATKIKQALAAQYWQMLMTLSLAQVLCVEPNKSIRKRKSNKL